MSKLSYYSEDWRRAEVVTSDLITPEDGQYRVIIKDVKYTEVDKEGKETDPTFIYTFQILEGKDKGLKFRRYTVIRNERSAGFLKGDLQKLGIPIPADPEELPELFTSAAGIMLELTVKTKNINGKEYKDIYFDKMLGKQRAEQPKQVKTPTPTRSQQAPEMPPFNPSIYDNNIPF